ncbi:MAG: hypothetical protein ACK5Y2_12950 [Bdellovibrionales bacterium]
MKKIWILFALAYAPLSWTQPLFQTYRKAPILGSSADDEDKDDVRTAIRVIQYFPRITLLRLGVGLTF